MKAKVKGGRLVKNPGRTFQMDFETVIPYFTRTEGIRFRKVDPPVRVMGSGSGRRVIFLPNPWPDYVGCWTGRGGRMIALELKSTDGPRLPLDSDGGLKESQIQAMNNWHAAGAAVAVLWESRREGVRVLIPWCRVWEVVNGARHEGGRCHLKPGDGLTLLDGLNGMAVGWALRQLFP